MFAIDLIITYLCQGERSNDIHVCSHFTFCSLNLPPLPPTSPSHLSLPPLPPTSRVVMMTCSQIMAQMEGTLIDMIALVLQNGVLGEPTRMHKEWSTHTCTLHVAHTCTLNVAHTCTCKVYTCTHLVLYILMLIMINEHASKNHVHGMLCQLLVPV